MLYPEISLFLIGITCDLLEYSQTFQLSRKKKKRKKTFKKLRNGNVEMLSYLDVRIWHLCFLINE